MYVFIDAFRNEREVSCMKSSMFVADLLATLWT